MKILAIFPNIDYSSASTIQIKSFLKNLSPEIDLKYYRITDNLNIDDISDYINLRSKFLDEKINTKNNEIVKICEVEKQLNENNFDLIFGWSTPYLASSIAIALGKIYKKPVVLRLGDFYMSQYSIKKLKEYANAKLIVVPNHILKEKVISFYSQDNIKVIPQHYEDYNEYFKYRSSTVATQSIKMIHAGNMYQERKIDIFIDALSKIKKEVDVSFVGCHDKLKDDIELCIKHNIKADFSKCYQFENWEFKKSIPFYELRKLINQHDILVHIEYISNDNHFLSFKLIDYLAYNKPIITISQKNSPNYYLSKECGFAFADIEDENQLIKAILSILENPERYIPNDNKLKYNIKNIIKLWEKEFYA